MIAKTVEKAIEKTSPLSLDDVRKLLALKGWTKVRLAQELELSEDAIHKWFRRGHALSGPAAIIMRQWLAEARSERKAIGV